MPRLKGQLQFILTFLALPLPVILAQKVVPLAFRRQTSKNGLSERALSVPLNNYIPTYGYYATVNVGTPPQQLELLLDTGSSDSWVFPPNVCNVSTSGGVCEGGTYDSSQSSTYVLLSQGTFMGRGLQNDIVGNYIADDFAIGGISVQNFTMAVATAANYSTSGVLGISTDVDEDIAIQDGFDVRYRNLPYQLNNQGTISSISYSLYLDNLASGAGIILFGGYDEAKFSGDLIMLPICGVNNSFAVTWTGISISNGSGTIIFDSTDFPSAMYLESAEVITYIPQDIFNSLSSPFGLTLDDTYGLYMVSCDVGATPGTVDFIFGGTDGPVIPVPFGELSIPLYETVGIEIVSSSGAQLCAFGLQPTPQGSYNMLGQSFLRSAYVLFDLDNLAAGLAPTVFDSTTSNIMDYVARDSSNDRVVSDTSGPKVDSAPTTSGAPVSTGTVTLTTTTDLAVTRSYPSDAVLPTSEVTPLTAIPFVTSSGSPIVTSDESSTTLTSGETTTTSPMFTLGGTSNTVVSGSTATSGSTGASASATSRPPNPHIGEDVGIGVGVGVGLLGLPAGVFVFRWRRRRSRQARYAYSGGQDVQEIQSDYPEH